MGDAAGDMGLVLHAWSGGPTTEGKATVVSSTFGVRALKALRTVGIGLIVAVVLLPVPVIHLAGIGIFVACLGIAAWQVRPGLRVRSVEGPCPHCGQPQQYWLGLNVGPMRFPKETSCEKCAKTLTIADGKRGSEDVLFAAHDGA
jgi:hypothetical protein